MCNYSDTINTLVFVLMLLLTALVVVPGLTTTKAYVKAWSGGLATKPGDGLYLVLFWLVLLPLMGGLWVSHAACP